MIESLPPWLFKLLWTSFAMLFLYWIIPRSLWMDAELPWEQEAQDIIDEIQRQEVEELDALDQAGLLK